MPTSRREFFKLAGGALAGAALSGTLIQQVKAYRASPQLPAATDSLLHLLNRLSYGVRPAEVEHARQLGFETYLDEQLNPATIPDDDMDKRLEKMPILFMDRKTIYQTNYRQPEVLVEGMIARAVYSQRQLLERMNEFWTDHFNIPGDSDQAGDLIILHRDIIRKHALGNFRDIAFGVAQSPAMLYYLNQAESDKEHPNENYARELLELHTLGVDGGYTETDVKEVARALTGWTVKDGTKTGFYFDKNMHDSDEKVILGHALPAGRGIEDGLAVLDLAVNHPATAHFICRKLCARFVSDQPPASLVESAAARWMETGGEIKPVLRHIFLSAEFAQSVGQKLRRPLDFFIGALRATGTEFRNYWTMYGMLEDLAQIPFGWHPPNGYPDAAGAWVNSGGLLARWNVAMDLTHRATSESDSGMNSHLMERIGSPQTVGQLVDNVAAQIFGAPLSEESRSPFINYASGEQGAATSVDARLLSRKLGTLYGLMLSSPLYQWR
jgi:uncharacterized protein (DUF1800 family)